MGPSIPLAMVRRQTIGPPDAPYPMTESTFPPFLGPRTCVYNTGNRMTGWLLHIPRFLTKDETAIATVNLRYATNQSSEWSYRHDPECKLGIKGLASDKAGLTNLLRQQGRAASFLKDIIGLDFAAQDEVAAQDDFIPIWIERTLLTTTPSTPIIPPKPSPIHTEQSLPQKHENEH